LYHEVKEFEIEDVCEKEKVPFIPLFGMDWGFANDPSTIVRVTVVGENLFIDYENGRKQIEIDDTSKIIDSVPLAKENLIRGDSARPEVISFIRRQGYNIVSVKKWGGSVEDGITYMRTYNKIYIHPAVIYELNQVSYRSGIYIALFTPESRICR